LLSQKVYVSIRYLILALTTRCNLKCRYCYYGDVPDAKDMPLDVMYRAISLAGVGEAPFHLQLTGGEPTLVPDLIKRAAVAALETGRCASIGLQTNASCLSTGMIKLFQAYAIQVGVSLDGPPAIHEQQRGRAAETIKGMQRLECNNIPFRVTTVVTGANASSLDGLVLTLAGFSQARGIGLDLLVHKGRAAEKTKILPVSVGALADGVGKMVGTLDRINARRSRPIRLRERDSITRSEKKSMTAFCHACMGQSMAVLPSGEIFPCSQTMGDPHFAAGTVWAHCLENLIGSLCRHRPRHSRCDGCVLTANCPGDCPSRLHYNLEEYPSRICTLYRTLWERR
jgi:uncharacterized protein